MRELTWDLVNHCRSLRARHHIEYPRPRNGPQSSYRNLNL